MKKSAKQHVKDSFTKHLVRRFFQSQSEQYEKINETAAESVCAAIEYSTPEQQEKLIGHADEIGAAVGRIIEHALKAWETLGEIERQVPAERIDEIESLFIEALEEAETSNRFAETIISEIAGKFPKTQAAIEKAESQM